MIGLIYFCRVYSLHAFLSTDILQGNFKPDFYLKYIQKDLRLAIALGDSVNHPTPMAAAANEVRVQMCVLLSVSSVGGVRAVCHQGTKSKSYVLRQRNRN